MTDDEVLGEMLDHLRAAAEASELFEQPELTDSARRLFAAAGAKRIPARKALVAMACADGLRRAAAGRHPIEVALRHVDDLLAEIEEGR